MKRYLLIFSILFFTGKVFSQQSPIFNNHFESPDINNPAFSGSKTYNPLVIQVRKQWLGFEDAPFSSNVSYGGAVNNRSALGINFVHDVTLPSQQSEMQLNYAYHIPLNDNNYNLAFGIGAKLLYYRLKFDISDIPPGQDPAFNVDLVDEFTGDASAGALFYSENFYFSYSQTNILESAFNTDDGKGFKLNNGYRNHYYDVSYSFNIIDNDWHLQPSIMINSNKNRTLYNFNTRLHHLKNKWIGTNYRSDNTIYFAFGFDLNDISISYCYEHSFNGNIMIHNYGSHQIGMTYKFVSELSERHISFWDY